MTMDTFNHPSNANFDALLHGFVDGALEANVSITTAHRLKDDAKALAFTDLWQRQNAALRSAFLHIMEDPQPVYIKTSRLETWRKPKTERPAQQPLVETAAPTKGGHVTSALYYMDETPDSTEQENDRAAKKSFWLKAFFSGKLFSSQAHLMLAMVMMFLAGGLSGVGFTNMLPHLLFNGASKQAAIADTKLDGYQALGFALYNNLNDTTPLFHNAERNLVVQRVADTLGYALPFTRFDDENLHLIKAHVVPGFSEQAGLFTFINNTGAHYQITIEAQGRGNSAPLASRYRALSPIASFAFSTPAYVITITGPGDRTTLTNIADDLLDHHDYKPTTLAMMMP